VLAFVALSLAVEDRTFVERSEAIDIPIGWRRTTSFAITQSKRKVDLIFALKQNNLDQLEETFWAVSDPKNARYGQHLSSASLRAMVGASESDVNTVVAWLKDQGCAEVLVGRSRDFVFARGVSLPLASRLLSIQFHTYRHSSGLSFDASLGPYSLPSNIADKIDLVTGVVGFPDMVQQRAKVNPAPSPAALEITPSVIRARYNISSTLVGTNAMNQHAVAEFQAQYYSPTDLKTFWTKYVPFAPFMAVAGVVGQNDPTSPGIEASLDIEYIMGVSPNITTYFYSLKAFNFWNDLMTWTGELDNETNPPFIHSVSYGSQGDYPSDAYRSRLNMEFQKLGTRGLSIIFASGDSGAGCEGGGITSKACDCTFFPSFPATCPYVTTVGATRFLAGNTGPEGAVQAFGSGGGFSQFFPTAPYQMDDVTAYLASGVQMPEACAFNASGRATPDVSALGDIHFQVVNGGSTISVGGTSASAPSFSAVMSLLNDQLLNAGKPVLGFLNTWIYQTASANPTAFFDVTVGDNINAGCCRSGAESGFECATGWDPVTGVGTPNFAVLSTLI